MSYGDGVDPVEDELIDRRMVAHNLRLRVTELEAKLAAAERELHIAVMSTHRQADCINQCAAAIGPDTSATIDGLPRAVRHLATRLSAAVKALETVRRWMGDPLAAHLPMKDIHSNREILGIIDAALKEARP